MKWELIFVNVSSVFFFLFSFFWISIYRKIWFWGIAGLEMLHSKSGKSLFTRFVFVTIMVILIDSNHFYDLNAPNFAISQTHSSGEAVDAVSFLKKKKKRFMVNGISFILFLFSVRKYWILFGNNGLWTFLWFFLWHQWIGLWGFLSFFFFSVDVDRIFFFGFRFFSSCMMLVRVIEIWCFEECIPWINLWLQLIEET